ncbi:MAG: HEAT repeat domain-containing protein [Thermaceae bacterium]|nr:HEAT repeat domain-containing protein [Thermaceae bacterium]
MAKRLEQKLAQVTQLRKGEPTPEAAKKLETLLAKEDGPVIARVAELALEWGLFEIQKALVAAFERLKAGGSDLDPQCWGKLALINSLQSLGWPDADVYVSGCRTVQPEPVWGGQEDSAPALRAKSALALSGCAGISYERAVDVFVRLLADPAWNVRAAAAQAIAGFGYPQAAPLLKLRVLVGDSEPRVIGVCLDGLLHLTGKDAVPFVQELLEPPNAVSLEAICALAAANIPEATRAAIQSWNKFIEARARKAIIAAFASSPTLEATEFLLGLLVGERGNALEALAALAPKLQDSSIRERARKAIKNNKSRVLRDELLALL